MKKVSIPEAENTLRALIDQVRGGRSILIVDRGHPVARIEPVIDLRTDDDRFARLVRDGVVRPARGPVPSAIVSTPPPPVKRGVSAVRALLDDRRRSR